MDQHTATARPRRRSPVRLYDRWTCLTTRLLGPVMRPAVMRMSIRREHRGFHVLTMVADDEGMNELAFARLSLALDLIAACDPRRFARIRRDMPNIDVVRVGGGMFSAVLVTCVVDWQAVTWRPVADLARTIVHEATHARLHTAGVGHPEAWKPRIERRCLLEEIAFARRVPDGGAWAAQLEAALEANLATEWWEPHKAIERTIRHARAERLPRWFVRLLERRQAWLAAKARNERGRRS